MESCLFCKCFGPYTTDEHVIPESLGNDKHILRGQVCDKCQRYFGTKVERYAISETPMGLWRVLAGLPTKRNRLPRLTLPLALQQDDPLRPIAPGSRVDFAARADGSVALRLEDSELVAEIAKGARKHLRLELPERHMIVMGRLLAKIGLELICETDPLDARHSRFDLVRRYARSGVSKEIWPVVLTRGPNRGDLIKQVDIDGQGHLEVTCTEFFIRKVADRYDLISLQLGPHMWTLCLNEQFPEPLIWRGLFDALDPQLILCPRRGPTPTYSMLIPTLCVAESFEADPVEER